MKTGITDEERIEIKTGLKGQETIVAGPFRTVHKELKDGMKVKQEEKKKEEK